MGSQAVLPAPRPPERAQSQVEKNHRRAYRKIPRNPAEAGPVLQEAHREDRSEDQKERAGHLEPKDAAHAAEGAQEASNAPACLGGDLHSRLPGGAVLGNRANSVMRGLA